MCTFGPDHGGKFHDEVVDDSLAGKCDPKFCICTSHEDYAEIRALRVENAQNKLVKPTPVEKEEDESEVLEPVE